MRFTTPKAPETRPWPSGWLICARFTLCSEAFVAVGDWHPLWRHGWPGTSETLYLTTAYYFIPVPWQAAARARDVFAVTAAGQNDQKLLHKTASRCQSSAPSTP
ncbi:hypothetical protein P8C59_000878 [Phyllachora maydis]|uniref:Uncharacterized protein n=1 Tax=Phyllachora maydis TaxID=1825666 RepID=A0AAD9HYK0_9PEZI|nr:hypothetical protein P8C59_000878 [Phyllachora maydis]